MMIDEALLFLAVEAGGILKTVLNEYHND